jgi:NAD(P)-dependent dehydrogenase (short-subunit alcohol dehydrogenase family)
MSKGVLVITGGSRGIGGATALVAAQAGYLTAIVYLQRDREAAELARRVEADGGQAALIRADVSKQEDVLRIFDEASMAGPIVGLVNNAGATGGTSRLVDLRVEQLMQAFQVNAIAPFLCAREAVRRMARSRGGSGGAIVNVSSAAARTGSPNVWVHYAASKAALDTMTIGLAKELAAEGIRVNSVRPGVIDTEIHSANPPELMARMAQAIPMGRMGKPEEVARTIVWLLSDEASYVTGAIVDAGGGY